MLRIPVIEPVEMTDIAEVMNNLLCDGLLRALTSREPQPPKLSLFVRTASSAIFYSL